MSVKLARYVFKKIRGRIVPIRKGLERATKSQNKLVDALIKDPEGKLSSEKAIKKFKKVGKFKIEGVKKLGSGIDFTVFKRPESNDFVIKKLKKVGGKFTKGTSNERLIKKYPELEDKLAVNKALADNLPNFGIPALENEIIRLKKGERGILQRYIPEQKNYNPSRDEEFKRLVREGQKIKIEHNLDIDVHAGNIRQGMLIDTGGNLKKSKVKMDDTAKELLGVEGYWNTRVKDLKNKSTVMSDEALLAGQSPKITRKIEALKKKGYRFRKVGKNKYELVRKKI